MTRDDRSAPGASTWEGLPTEARNPRSTELDLLPTRAAVELLIDEDRRGLEAVARASGELAAAAEWLAETLEAGGSALLVGAGTSGRLGVLEAAECPPTFGTDPERIRAEIAGGAGAVFRAVEGAEDIESDGREIAAGLGEQDLLIAISASSVTPYAQGAIAAARRRGTRTILVTCTGPERARGAADLVIALDTGPEVLTGSTRLKAGSATKAALNAITTAAMVRAGKVYENLMVDLRRGSAKLRDRAARIVVTAGRVERDRAEELLELAGGEVKVALVMARAGLDSGEARRRLARAGGHVRRALEQPSDTGPARD